MAASVCVCAQLLLLPLSLLSLSFPPLLWQPIGGDGESSCCAAAVGYTIIPMRSEWDEMRWRAALMEYCSAAAAADAQFAMPSGKG